VVGSARRAAVRDLLLSAAHLLVATELCGMGAITGAELTYVRFRTSTELHADESNGRSGQPLELPFSGSAFTGWCGV